MIMFFRRFRESEKGVSIIETLTALGIIAIIATGFITALGTGAKATYIAGERTMAESLARSEIEYIKSCSYNPADPPESYLIDPGLSVGGEWNVATFTAQVHGVEDGIQKVTVEVRHEGKLILSVDAYKVNR